MTEALKDINSIQEGLERISVGGYENLVPVMRLRNMALVSEMMCRAALARTESRGAHWRTDYPEENGKEWLRYIEVRNEDNKVKLDTVPVELLYVTPG